MARSEAKTVEGYLNELPDGRRQTVEAVRDVVNENLPDGYEETMQHGMISYVVPLAQYPTTYNRQPLQYAGLASQKNYVSLCLMNVYGSEETERQFVERYAASGKKLDMGKSCVHFKELDDLPLDLIGETIARTPVDEFIATYETARGTK
jgi:hypothetical protein